MRPTFLCLLFLLCLSGCVNWGYQQFQRDELNLYDDMLADFIKPYSGRTWFWVRGRVGGNLDGDESDEEVVLASIHEGTKSNSNPILQLVVLVTERDRKGNPILLRRMVVFDATKTLSEAAIPEGVHLDRQDKPMLSASAKIVDCAGDGYGLLLITLHSRTEGGRLLAYHAGFVLPDDDGPLKKVFQTLCVQRDAVLTTLDLNKDGVDEILVDQQVLTAKQAPEGGELDPPYWRSVFSRSPEGHWKQSDSTHRRAYELLLLPWYTHYIQAIHTGSSRETLAHYEYYLGRCHLMLNQRQQAQMLLSKSVKEGRDRLKQLSSTALDRCK